ncbi:hypothetical protein TIFTF001_056560 [Ficus carica]|uniref:Uncharacterized protein n=1 Tax=Ficus carica TaxID=3494 RepID=A0AA88EQ34_FICCA|nr:hypothetical protein TIFTF001_056664 [Ficus carica]GMN75444.1 hypothetical protein TIFTF001_056773 [Ficus carica]GMN75449.1 hypothetical protein TIFTF001_056775 [Ficus carica]GMN75662.1 hypothetical protein TIFTF001_056560 [Ficus carica]
MAPCGDCWLGRGRP